MKISNEPDALEKEVKVVREGLNQYNFKKAGITAPIPVNIFLRTDEGEIKGGLIGGMQGGWLHVAELWIDEEYRRNDHGTELLRCAEILARDSGCKAIGLSTADFQAPGFYLKLGFVCWGVLNDHPVGH